MNMTRYTSYTTVNDGLRFEGVTGYSHNSVQARTRRLFSGQGYRMDTDASRVGRLVLQNKRGDRLVIETVLTQLSDGSPAP